MYNYDDHDNVFLLIFLLRIRRLGVMSNNAICTLGSLYIIIMCYTVCCTVYI